MFDTIRKLFGQKKSGSQAKGRRILVIEDGPVDRKIIENALVQYGYTPILAELGEKGITLARKEKPDLIILDYSLPDIDGKAVCKRLKNEEDTDKIPVIFLTARISPNTVIDCYDVGAEHYLVKPISPSALIDQIEETLGTKSG